MYSNTTLRTKHDIREYMKKLCIEFTYFFNLLLEKKGESCILHVKCMITHSILFYVFVKTAATYYHPNAHEFGIFGVRVKLYMAYIDTRKINTQLLQCIGCLGYINHHKNEG